MDIHTPRLHIRPFRPDDLDGLYALVSDSGVMEHIEPPYSRAQAAALLDRALHGDPPFGYAVEDKAGRFAGYIICHPYDAESWELGWLLRPDTWGMGYATELTRALIAHARGKTGGLVLECAPAQGATRAIAAKCGFRYAGLEDGLELYRLDFQHQQG